MRSGRAIALMVPVLAVVMGACARATTGGTGSGGIQHPTDPSHLILKVDVGGGFVSPQVTLRRAPAFALYGDGRVITEGPQIEIYPGPALPNLQVTRLTEVGIQAILEAAHDAGLTGPDRQFTTMTIADAPTTTFTLVADGQRHVTSVYALGEVTDATQGIPSDEFEARTQLSAFYAKLTDLRSWLPQGSVGDDTPYSFDELRIFVLGESANPEPGLEQVPVDWPLAAQPLATFGQPMGSGFNGRCGSVAGADLTTLRPLVMKSNELTPWQSAGQSFTLVFQPLLPDESGCPA
jgi:hypothetical protein